MCQHLRQFIACIIVIHGILWPHTASAAASTHCFVQTGFCVDALLFPYWQKNGGVAVFGYPISNIQRESVEGVTLNIQWFERDRLEVQPDGSITTGRLGARLLDYMQTPWHIGDGRIVDVPFTAPSPIPPLLPPDILVHDCTAFARTGYQSCGLFARYWQHNGGLTRFGYPITPLRMVELEDGNWYWVQYYERRRLEYHPESANNAFTVLLGLLGTQLANPRNPPCMYGVNPAFVNAFQIIATTRYLGCPVANDTGPTYDLPAAVQSFTAGQMLWVDYPPEGDYNGDAIYAIVDTNPSQIYHVIDTWRPGDANTLTGSMPPIGLYAPWRGFGVAWNHDSTLASAIGWATTPQPSATRVDVQRFSTGILMIHMPTTHRVFVFDDTQYPSILTTITASYP